MFWTLPREISRSEAILLRLTPSFPIISFLIALRIRETLTERRQNVSRLLLDVPKVVELLDDFVDGPWEHLQAFRNAPRSDAESEKLGDGGAIGVDLLS